MAVAAYLVAAGLIVVPLAETFLSVWPLHPGTVSWRFGAAGLLSRGLLTSLLGFMLAVGLAAFLGHRRTLRLLAALSGFGFLLLVPAVMLLALDAMQLKHSVRPQVSTGYDLAAIGAIMKMFLACVVTALVAIGGWKMSRRAKRAPAAAPPLAYRPRKAEPTRSQPSSSAPPELAAPSSPTLSREILP